MQIKFDKIPQEMREFHQWVCWRYEERGSKKPTKVPYDPKTGSMASVTAPETWRSFNDCVWAATAQGTSYDGIGFVLTENDPYTIVDLDKAKDDLELQRQMKVFESLNSYSERSPSGDGLHIVVKAKIPQGRRRCNIELYHDSRYMTMTGDVYLDLPIIERQDVITMVYNQMGAGAGEKYYSKEGKPETQSDADLLQTALNAENGVKFKELHEGRWEGLYSSQSEADFAYLDILGFYSQNINQLLRLFWASPLGARPKAKRMEYVLGMIHKSFDNQLDPIDLIENQDAAARAIATGTLPVIPMTQEGEDSEILQKIKTLAPLGPLTMPPGLMGEIAKYIYDSAWLQIPEVAIASAIGLMSGITGRAYNINGLGLNMYTLLLGPTGIGKEQLNTGPNKLMNMVAKTMPTDTAIPAAANFIGPSELASGQALLKRLADPNKRSFVSIIGEFGYKMQQLSHPRASTSELMLKRVLLDLYNKSGFGNMLGASEYAQKENNVEAVPNPAVSVLGEATPSTFFAAIDEKMITDGLLPRFLIIQYEGKVPYGNENCVKVFPTVELLQRLGALCVNSLSLQARNMVHNVEKTQEAKDFLWKFHCLAIDLINQTGKDALRELWNRAHTKVLKLASHLAVGNNPYDPCITLQDVHWAFNVVVNDILTISGKFSRGEIGKNSEESEQYKTLLESAVEYITRSYDELKGYDIDRKLHEEKVIPKSFFQNRAGKKAVFKNDPMRSTAALDKMIRAACECGDLEEIGKGEMWNVYKSKARGFQLKNLDRLPKNLGK